jgi:hypothetical protein
MKKNCFIAWLDRETHSAIIMNDNNEHVESLVQREGETDETWDEFTVRVDHRVSYLNNNN